MHTRPLPTHKHSTETVAVWEIMTSRLSSPLTSVRWVMITLLKSRSIPSEAISLSSHLIMWKAIIIKLRTRSTPYPKASPNSSSQLRRKIRAWTKLLLVYSRMEPSRILYQSEIWWLNKLSEVVILPIKVSKWCRHNSRHSERVDSTLNLNLLAPNRHSFLLVLIQTWWLGEWNSRRTWPTITRLEMKLMLMVTQECSATDRLHQEKANRWTSLRELNGLTRT